MNVEGVGDVSAAHFSSEREALRTSLRQLLRGTESGDHDSALSLWYRVEQTFGIAGMTVPVERGGLGLGMAEMAVVMEEFGRALASTPALGSVCLATTLLVGLDPTQARDATLRNLAAGAAIATLAWRDVAQTETIAANSGDGYTLRGHKFLVAELPNATTVIVTARLNNSAALFLIDPCERGALRTATPTLDETRAMGALQLDDTPAQLLAAGPTARTAIEDSFSRARVLLAAEQLGVAQRCFDECIAYLKERVQYERPLASFQVIKHRCADMYVDIESLRSAVQYACSAPTEEPTTSGVVGAHGLHVLQTVAAQCLHLHGAAGFTWAHRAHRYLKRSLVDAQLLGDLVERREALFATHLSGRRGVERKGVAVGQGP